MTSDFELAKDQTRIWDLDVPIVIKDNKVDVYLYDNIEEPFVYSELCYILQTATEDMLITLHINTLGGVIDSAFMIIDAIKQSKARVIAHLAGTVASAGTIITMACDDIYVANHTAFMIHNYSASGLRGKGHELKDYINFSNKALNKAFTEIYSGFLTPDEMDEIIDGRDYWLDEDEVIARWARKKANTPLPRIDDTIKKRGRPRKA